MGSSLAGASRTGYGQTGRTGQRLPTRADARAAFSGQPFCGSTLTWASPVFLQRMADHVVPEWSPKSGTTLLNPFFGVPDSVLGVSSRSHEATLGLGDLCFMLFLMFFFNTSGTKIIRMNAISREMERN